MKTGRHPAPRPALGDYLGDLPRSAAVYLALQLLGLVIMTAVFWAGWIARDEIAAHLTRTS